MKTTRRLWSFLRIRDYGKRTTVSVRLSANNPAQNIDDHVWQSHRLAEAVLLGHDGNGCELYCDTFADSDRGYLPHAGVVDRRYNPRAGMLVIQHLNSLLVDIPETEPLTREYLDGLAIYNLCRGKRKCFVCVPHPEAIMPGTLQQ